MQGKNVPPWGASAGSMQRPVDSILIKGFKSIRDETVLEIRPLTVLAGANSSGKSSAIQPLLLLKQTLEASYDPGPLLLSGPNVKFTDLEQQVFWRRKGPEGEEASHFKVGLFRSVNGDKTSVTLAYGKRDGRETQITEMESEDTLNGSMTVKEGWTDTDLGEFPVFRVEPSQNMTMSRLVTRRRCFLGFDCAARDRVSEEVRFSAWISPCHAFEPAIRTLVHLPGLRGNPERNYPLAPGGPSFPGPFHPYAAGVVYGWHESGDPRLGELGEMLRTLGLTWKVKARKISDVEVELQVGRLSEAVRGGAHDLVSIADVGVGISQTLPVAVALLVAEPRQIVYIEQPEIHLHPNAQVALAGPLLDAAERGVIVIVETHSQMLLLGIQERIASEASYDPGLVKLHWFTRDDGGATKVTSADLDSNGAYGDWPEDFARVAMDIEHRYLSSPFRQTDE